MKTKPHIRQWLLFFVLVAIALYLHVQYPIESVVGPAPDDSAVESSADAPDAATPDVANTALPKAVLPPKSAGLRSATHASTDRATAFDTRAGRAGALETSDVRGDAQAATQADVHPRQMPPHWIQL